MAGLRAALLRRPEIVRRHADREAADLRASAAALDYYDAPAVRKIVRDAARKDYRFSSIVLGIVESAPFQMRGSQ